jgi:SAM-dependent methyltransferase
MKLFDSLHRQFLIPRRSRVLAEHIASLLPRDASVLDVGTGDGRIAALVAGRRPDLKICGIEVQLREGASIPVEPFDGRTIPFADDEFDVVSFIDVLHHADDPLRLLREGRRVARRSMLIKDHTRDGFFARPTLQLMDWVANRRFGMAVPADYWTEARWRHAFEELGLRPAAWKRDLAIYPWPTTIFCDRSLHCLVRLEF